MERSFDSQLYLTASSLNGLLVTFNKRDSHITVQKPPACKGLKR